MTQIISIASPSKSLASRRAEGADGARLPAPAPPAYLLELYWWAYAHPNAVRVFERDWLINAILWGNYPRLSRAAIEAVGPDYKGRTLQIACAYGDFTPRLADPILAAGGDLDVIDALPVQIDNLARKLGEDSAVRLSLMDSAALGFGDSTFDRAVLFLLLHEQPEAWRRRTLSEAARVLKPGGRLVIVDYAQPKRRHPLRYLFPPVLARLEPFALDLWRRPIESFVEGLPLRPAAPLRRFFGGLYQLAVFERCP